MVPSLTAHARKIADAGFRVVIPDLYRGKAGYDAEEAKHNMNSLDFKVRLAAAGFGNGRRCGPVLVCPSAES